MIGQNAPEAEILFLIIRQKKPSLNANKWVSTVLVFASPHVRGNLCLSRRQREKFVSSAFCNRTRQVFYGIKKKIRLYRYLSFKKYWHLLLQKTFYSEGWIHIRFHVFCCFFFSLKPIPFPEWKYEKKKKNYPLIQGSIPVEMQSFVLKINIYYFNKITITTNYHYNYHFN